MSKFASNGKKSFVPYQYMSPETHATRLWLSEIQSKYINETEYRIFVDEKGNEYIFDENNSTFRDSNINGTSHCSCAVFRKIIQ